MIAGNSFCPGNLADGCQSQEQTQQQKEIGSTLAKEVIKAHALCAHNFMCHSTHSMAETLLSVIPMLLSLPSKPVTRTHVWDSTYTTQLGQ